jgi:predicted transposase YdaD
VITGLILDRRPDGRVWLEFRYLTVRVWQQPVDAVLAGGLATLPLAPLAAGAEAVLPEIVRRMDERLSRETTPSDAVQLWTAAYVLMGLRYPDEVTRELLRGVRNMRESTTYQAILAEGRAEGWAEGEAQGVARGRADEARRIVLRLGRQTLGPPDTRISAELRRIADLEQLEQLADRVLVASSWDELLAGH